MWVSDSNKLEMRMKGQLLGDIERKGGSLQCPVCEVKVLEGVLTQVNFKPLSLLEYECRRTPMASLVDCLQDLPIVPLHQLCAFQLSRQDLEANYFILCSIAL